MERRKVDKEARERQRILTPEFRVSYPHVFKPNAMQGSKPKYSITMLFPKNADLGVIKEAIRQAKLNAYGPKENWPSDLESPVTDGDAAKHADKEGYKGHWVIKASTNEDSKPGVVDANVEEILNQGDFYPGCYARAYIFAFAWEFAGKRGISFILDHVQKLRDGKAFGGKKPVDQVFQPHQGKSSLEDEEHDDNNFL
jgi:hypothetical protein